MVRRGARSRGCRVCRQRKIKCDEGVPECSQCLHSRRKCPGPIAGSFFIAMDVKTQQKSESPPALTRAEKTRKREKETVCTALVSSTLASSIGPHQQFSKAFNLNFPLPPDCRTLVATAADRQYLGCFLSSYHNTSLTPILFHYSTRPMFIFAARAGTMAFYGKMMSDVVLQRESSAWYEKALQLQLARLTRRDGSSPDDDLQLPTAEDVLTPLMLALYETALCTSPMGWVHHLSAGATMLEKLGPERCQTGDFHIILRGVRTNMVYISATIGKASIFASEEWRTIPFVLTVKSPIDELVDILLWIPHLLDTHTQWAAVKDTILPEAEMLRQQLAIQIQHPINRLAEWWLKHGPAIFGDYDYADYVEGLNWVPPVFHETSTATTIAFYNTAKVFVLHIQSTGQGMPVEKVLTMHAASVIAAARFHQSRGPQSGGTFVMVFPLKSVCLMTPDDSQRREAQEILLEWGVERGIEGACSRAAPQYIENKREGRAKS